MENNDGSNLSGGDIAWIVFGCFFVIGAFLIVVGYLLYQKVPTKKLTEKFERAKKQNDEETPKKATSKSENTTTVVTSSTTVFRSTN